jgi:guanosine-3',5'-bis(diphosphate) 3'-pyrophosphohydrolase
MRLDDLLERLTEYAPDADTDLVTRAYFFAARAHDKQTRKSGEPYFIHPLAVAGLLTELGMDVDTLATALLHDTMEDCMVTREQIAGEFNETVAGLVEGVTKIGKLRFRSKEEAAAENFRKMLLAMSQDIRVLLVKLADRLHNMRTLEHMRDDKRRRIAEETFEIYIPLAGRLGIHSMRVELENLCFRYLYPERYEELTEKLAQTAADRDAYIGRVVSELERQLAEMNIEGQVSGRVKHLWSIYRKMVEQHLEFEQVHDLLAFRVLVDDIGHCYGVLGQIHGLYRPVQGRIKDYIAMPKQNGYQSLHTTVIGPEAQRIEIQIRTHRMHAIAESGIAAHWQYKEGHLAVRPEEVAEVARLREVFEAAREVEDAEEFMEAVKIDLFTEDVYIFTPAGDVKAFPVGAVALDFAYAVHTQVGHRCVGAKVNGKMVGLRYELQSGDTVEILTGSDQHPRQDWLNIVKTGRALRAIRRYLRQQERETGVRMGRDMLEQALKKRSSSLNRVHRSGDLKRVLKERSYRDLDAMLLDLSRGHETTTQIARALLPDSPEPEPAEKEEPQNALARFIQKFRRTAESPVTVGGEGDVLVTFAGCCTPLPREPIVGYVTRGRGIAIHRSSCPQVLNLEPERRLSVEWSATAGGRHLSGIRVICVNQPGLLANITQTCSDAGINIARAEARGLGDDKAECTFDVGVGSVDELNKLIRRISRINGVIAVDRLHN